jgi:hypothetical protein
MSKEIYVVTDIESDGPIPGPFSMLSFASAAIDREGNQKGTFTANLEQLHDAKTDPSTMEWWSKQGNAWDLCRENLQSPERAMKDYVKWIKGLPGKPVFVGYPAGFDFTFIYWYLIRFAGESPFTFAALDMKSYVMALMNSDPKFTDNGWVGFRDIGKKMMPKEWFGNTRHTHVALDDAIEQAELFAGILKAQLNY